MEAQAMPCLFDELDEYGREYSVDLGDLDLSLLGQGGARSDSPSYSSNTVTLATLNDTRAETEGFPNFDMEDGAFLLNNLQETVEPEHAEADMKFTANLRSPSPMSVTASVSGSESYSLCSPNRSDVDDAELFELLQDSGIQTNDTEEADATLNMPAEPAMPEKLPVRRKSSSSSNSGNTSARGVRPQNGPWCKTKNRNNSKNAIAARENRQKKKQYVLSLEEINAKLTEENARMKRESAANRKKISTLESEVCYLRKVLFNQSALAGLLKRLNQKNVRLSSNFSTETSQEEEASTSIDKGGICLHTDGEDTVLRFCSLCARKDQP